MIAFPRFVIRFALVCGIVATIRPVIARPHNFMVLASLPAALRWLEGTYQREGKSMRFTNIIVAVDVHDSENGRAALSRSAAIAEADGRLNLLYVRYFLPQRYTELLASDFDLDEEADALKTMRQWCAAAGVDEARTRFITRRGRVRDEVIAEATEQNADLIVIGAHPPSLSSRLLGSNASAIVHQSPVSVLVVRHEG